MLRTPPSDKLVTSNIKPGESGVPLFGLKSVYDNYMHSLKEVFNI